MKDKKENQESQEEEIRNLFSRSAINELDRRTIEWCDVLAKSFKKNKLNSHNHDKIKK